MKQQKYVLNANSRYRIIVFATCFNSCVGAMDNLSHAMHLVWFLCVEPCFRFFFIPKFPFHIYMSDLLSVSVKFAEMKLYVVNLKKLTIFVYINVSWLS